MLISFLKKNILCYCSVYSLFIFLHLSFESFLAKKFLQWQKLRMTTPKFITKVKIKINKFQYPKPCLCVGWKLWRLQFCSRSTNMLWVIVIPYNGNILSIPWWIFSALALIQIITLDCGEALTIQCSMWLAECPTIQALMQKGSHNPKFVWLRFHWVSYVIGGVRY